MKIIQQGAEAVLCLREDGVLVKDRIKKGYRIPQIDEKLRKIRTRKEAKLLKDSPIPTPMVLSVDDKEMRIRMEYLEGNLLKNVLDSFSPKKQEAVCKQIGENISALHDKNIIHGDLTTSNMILKDEKVYFIDFGLGFVSSKPEDKAVDLFLLKKALDAKHHLVSKHCFEAVLNGYKKSKNFSETIERLERVESRGRYKKR